MSLADHLICDALMDDGEMQLVKENLINLTELDLSYNLLSNIDYLCQIISHLTNLQTIDLSGNRFVGRIPHNASYLFTQVKSLSLVDCGLDNEQLRNLFMIFPSIVKLDISKNALLDIEDEKLVFPKSMKELDFNYNKLKHLSQNLFGPNIEILNMSHNEIEFVEVGFSLCLKNIDLSYNRINCWEAVDQLNANFPQLYSLRVNKNPLLWKDDISSFYEVIGRLNNIKIVNGSFLSDELRYEAELFFVSKLRDGETSLNKSLKRWELLSHRYRITPTSMVPMKTGLDQVLLEVSLVDQDKHKTEHLTVLSSYSVRYLKCICCKKLNMNMFRIKIYHGVSSEVVDELDRDFYTLSHFNINDGDTIYLKTK